MQQGPSMYWLETYGCQMNFAESNALEIDLLNQGYSPASFPEEASVVIINTCSVRKTAENRIWGRLGFFKRMKNSRKLTVILTGCMAERLLGESLKEYGVDAVIGTAGKNHIVSYLTGGDEHLEVYEFQKSHHKEGETRSFIPIMNGCSNYCSYCIVPYVRGSEISRNPNEILEEMKSLEDRGVKEIVLLGQNVNSYRWTCGDLTVTFTDLLQNIELNTQGIRWIRFLSSHPKDVSPELGPLMGEHRQICRHLHLPVQHGSDRVLKHMNRKYTREEYLRIIESLRSDIPEITFSTDLLIGFPGENEQDLEDTRSLMREVSYTDAFTYYYNPREGTKALELPDQLSDEVKLARLKQVIDLQKELGLKEKAKRIGSIEEVIVEDRTKKDHNELLARTEHDDMVIVERGSLNKGDMIHVRLSELAGNTFKGEVVPCGK